MAEENNSGSSAEKILSYISLNGETYGFKLGEDGGNALNSLNSKIKELEDFIKNNNNSNSNITQEELLKLYQDILEDSKNKINEVKASLSACQSSLYNTNGQVVKLEASIKNTEANFNQKIGSVKNIVENTEYKILA
jgi:predicted  nucleic acid-binding Zn-ribbon protein